MSLVQEAHVPDEPKPPVFRFDGTINIGSILLLATMIVGGLIAYTQMSDGIATLKANQAETSARLEKIEKKLNDNSETIAGIKAVQDRNTGAK